MTDIINLNKQRKTKAKNQQVKQAAENRRKFGRSKEEKKQDVKNAKKQEHFIDGHKRDPE